MERLCGAVVVPQYVELSHFRRGIRPFAIYRVVPKVSDTAGIGDTIVVNARCRAVILSVCRILNEYVLQLTTARGELIISDVFFNFECGRKIQIVLDVKAAAVGRAFLWRFR